MVKCSVLFEAWAEYLNIIFTSFSFKQWQHIDRQGCPRSPTVNSSSAEQPLEKEILHPETALEGKTITSCNRQFL
jgi:hypothetical protein